MALFRGSQAPFRRARSRRCSIANRRFARLYVCGTRRHRAASDRANYQQSAIFHCPGHGPTCVRRSRFHDCADLVARWEARAARANQRVRGMVLDRVATAGAIGPKTADGIWRRSRRSASKAGRAVYLFSLHTIYRVLRISLMHLMQSAHQDRSDHFVQHGQRIISRIFFWSNCAHGATRDRAASVPAGTASRTPEDRASGQPRLDALP